MYSITLIPIIISFVATLILIPFWMKKAKTIKLEWPDMNKSDKKLRVLGSGGLPVTVGIALGILSYVFIITFYWHSLENLTFIFALLITILLLGGIGIIDDLIGWRRGGLSKKSRLLMCLFAAIPIIAISASQKFIDFPLLTGIDIGLFYSLLLVPIGIIGAATTFNFLAGFNGLEAGQGILILLALSLVTFLRDDRWLALMGLIAVVALLAFWFFNKFPAKIFPGDSLTYPIGGLIAIIAIMGNIEKIAIFFFIPYLIEIGLKARGKFEKWSFGKPNKDNSLELRYKKIYGLEHLAIWLLQKIKKSGKVYENEVVYFIYLIQFLIIDIGLIIFRNSIFT